MSSAQIICVHVVPDFGGVLMMMSLARAVYCCQRFLSQMSDRYRTGMLATTSDQPVPMESGSVARSIDASTPRR
jgi:hypothetical protein